MNDKHVTFYSTSGINSDEPNKLMEWFDKPLTIVVPDRTAREALKIVLSNTMHQYIETSHNSRERIREGYGVGCTCGIFSRENREHLSGCKFYGGASDASA